jgi:hypothetical protein
MGTVQRVWDNDDGTIGRGRGGLNERFVVARSPGLHQNVLHDAVLIAPSTARYRWCNTSLMPMNISAGIVNFNRCRDMRGRSVVSEIGGRTSIE